MNDIHLLGLPLSTTNRIRCKGAPSSTRMLFSSRGFPEQGMGFLHTIPTFNKRIESASIASPSPNENGFAPKGSTSKRMGFASRRSPSISRESPSPNVWDSRQEGHPLLSEWVSLLTSGLVSTGALFKGHASHGIPFHKGFRLYL